jgi:hypothetical protein
VRRDFAIAARRHGADVFGRAIVRPAEHDHLVGRRVGLHVDGAGVAGADGPGP